MNLKDPKQVLARMVPASVKAAIRRRRDIKDLNAIQRIDCEVGNLRRHSTISLDDIFNAGEIERIWHVSKKEINRFKIPDGTGGVNPGDRRAVYYLISKLMPSSVLEVGTHIGASTLHIASALYMSQIKNGRTAGLTTVDFRDVNSPVERPWEKFNTSKSPREMIDTLNYGDFIEFIVDTSINYATYCSKKFDFIFLDGDHSASTVYEEVPVALNLLNDNGVILLHDYFPDLKPLWSNDSVIPGPFLALQRLLREGVNVRVLPLGALPWPTKLQSNVTSLALLLRND